MPELPFDTVLFDVDGTLIDSTYHHAIAWSMAFQRFDLQPPLWRIHRAIGMGGDQLVSHIAGDEVEEKHGEQLREAWQEEYDKLLPQVRAFEKAADALKAVRQRGLKVALASSGEKQFTDEAMKMIGITEDDVDAVTCSDDADASKPEPDILEAALKAAGGSKAILIGDSTWDVESAKRIDMPTLGVRTGGFSEAEMTEAGAIHVVDAVTDLADGSWLDADWVSSK